MGSEVNGQASPVLFSSSPLTNFSMTTTSIGNYYHMRSGSVSSGLPLTVREDCDKIEMPVQNGINDDIHIKGFYKKCDKYDHQMNLTPSQLEVQQEFQKLQIRQLQEKLHHHQLQLQQTQKLLQQQRHIGEDEQRPNSRQGQQMPVDGLKEMNISDTEGRVFQPPSLMPLIENRENLSDYQFGHLAVNDDMNSDDFDPKYPISHLPRCYSVGSTGLGHLYRKPNVFKGRENLLSNNKRNSNTESSFLNDIDSPSGHLKAAYENQKRQYRSENCDSSALPTTAKAIDLRCKRKRSLDSKGIAESVLDDQSHPLQLQNSHIVSRRDQHSILKSVLTSSSPSVEGGGRLRSHTLSVCSLQGLRRSGASSAYLFSDSRRVTLAKKNLAPVQRFVIDQLKEIVKFAWRQPDFNQLPMEDRKALLVQAGPRLLLLYMAELNFKFAVTLLWEPVEKLVDSSFSLEKLSPSEEKSAMIRKEVPTQRFVETIQNFIGKCQSQSITTNEYFFMRLIVLFHIGSEPLSESKLVAKRHNEAQQDLQALSAEKFPSDRLRYSKLLLTLYTLFGVDGLLVENLFYSSENHFNMAEFLCNELENIGSKPTPFQVNIGEKPHM